MARCRGTLQMTALLLLTGLMMVSRPVHADTANLDAFTLKPSREAALIIAGLVFQQVGSNAVEKLNGPDPAAIDKNDLPVFERFASEYYSKKISYFSDHTKDATTGLMFLATSVLLKDRKRENIAAFVTDMAMYIESQTILVGLTKCAKGFAGRSRPYAYNPDLSSGKRGSRNAAQSFWSGHASLAFTTAVFTGYVFQHHHPQSRLIKPIWITGLGCATATSVLRVRSGNHFPTDVIAGAAVGSFIGWFVPRMHREKESNYRCEFVTTDDDITLMRVTCDF